MFHFLHTHLPDPIAFTIGPIAIHWYGMLIVVAIFIGLLLTAKIGSRYGISKDQVYDLGFWAIIFAIVGARVYFMFLELPYFLANPLDAIKVWQGGLAIHGAIIGGLLAVYFYLFRDPRNKFDNHSLSDDGEGRGEVAENDTGHKRSRKFSIRNLTLTLSHRERVSMGNRVSIWLWLDAVAPALALGQAIGRWGNYFNQELFGRPTNLPWGIPIAEFNRPVQFFNEQFFHPTFLYESVLNLIIFVVLIILHIRRIRARHSRAGGNPEIPDQTRDDRQAGSIFLIYLILYSLVRIFTETLRLDETITIVGIRLPQIVSGLIILASVYLLVKKSKLTSQNN